MSDIIADLDAPDLESRLAAARATGAAISEGTLERSVTEEINNHVHTIYSFSPYSPSAAAYRAWKAGLQTVGVMDHDSIAGGEEMLDASSAIGIASTIGFEQRVSFSGTSVEGRKLNNPDSTNIAYIAIHGIPRRSIPAVRDYLAPIQEARNKRNRAQTDGLNTIIEGWNIGKLDFDRDVYGASMAAEGGSITERHILFALSKAVVNAVGRGPATVRFLRERAGLSVPEKVAGYLEDAVNPHYLYDLLGVLKGAFIQRFYIQPEDDECINVDRAISFAGEIGAISAYAYLGDVTDSPTGDKTPEQFEDSYLDELFDELDRIGFNAITYMPPRNTKDQLRRVQALCRAHGFMEISGVDINSSRQSFSCPEVVEPDFYHLTHAAWALIAHEKLGLPEFGLFHPDNPWANESLEVRIATYARFGRGMDPWNPESIVELANKERKKS